MTPSADILRAGYARDGYVVVRDLLPRAEILRLRAHTEQLIARGDQAPSARLTQTVYDKSGAVKLIKISSLVEHDPEFRGLGTSTPLVDVVEALLGEGAKRFRDVMIVKPARSSGVFSYHQDSAYWDVEPKALVSCWVSLGDVDETASPLAVVPGTHDQLVEHGLFLRGKRAVPRPIVRGLRGLVSLAGTGDNPDASGNMALWKLKRLVLTQATRYAPWLFDFQDFRIPPDTIDRTREKLIPVRAGDAVFFHSLLWHASGPNRSDQPRYASIISFMGPDARYVGRGGDHFPMARSA